MKILLTGVTGYIGKRLMHQLLADGHELVCAVRDAERLSGSVIDSVQVIECDFLDPASLVQIPEDIEAAYYLIHSMSASIGNFENDEKQSAYNFMISMERTSVKQVIYLSGVVNQSKLSKHLSSRKAVEDILSGGSFELTTLRAGIIVGSGSASFEIIRDLVEKLPIMIAPKWLHTNSQPIAIRNVLQFLKGVLGLPYAFGKSFDIGGPEVINYKDMLLRFANVRKLRRRIWVVPVMTPKLSSYWLYFITSTSYKLAVNLVDSMKVDVVCKPNDLAKRLNIELIAYEDAVKAAFERIAQFSVPSSWIDAQSRNILNDGVSKLMNVPEQGCFKDKKKVLIGDPATALEQTATFRPLGLWGKLYWYSVLPFHALIFRGMLKRISTNSLMINKHS